MLKTDCPTMFYF